MHTQVVVAGLGVAGTWLSFRLHQAGIPFVVFDPLLAGASSPVASGVINPVTGRRLTKTWLAETLLPNAWESYQEMGQLLGQSLIAETPIIDCFGAPDKRVAFQEKAASYHEYLHWPENEQDLQHLLRYELGYGKVAPAYRIYLHDLLSGWRSYLRQAGKLVEEALPLQVVFGANNVEVGDLKADYLIDCTGKWAAEAGHFKRLPFALNKGEALLFEIIGDELPPAIYKKTNTIVPWKLGMWWAGSTYQNQYADDAPTEAFRLGMEQWLRHFIRADIRIVDHLAAIRPATVERRPFVGWHPTQPRLGLLNGLGTKGVSLAPYFSQQLVESILFGNSLDPAVDILRHQRILSKS